MEGNERAYKKNSIRKTLILFLLLAFVVLPVVVTTVFILSTSSLIKKSYEESLIHSSEIKKIAVEEWLRKTKDVAKQIASRYIIREELVKYEKGEVSLEGIRDIADAILFAWYPGEQGGLAVADILFGKVSPSGRLPVTFYKSIKDLPPFDDYKMEGRTYRFFKGIPLYPFGYGLSYTKFKCIGAELPKKIHWSSKVVNIKVKLKNTGEFDGEEVVQVYVRKINPGKFRPLKQLVGFSRVFLKRGETKSVSIKIELEPLRYYDSKSKKFKFENGKYEILVGFSSSDIRLKKVIEISPKSS